MKARSVKSQSIPLNMVGSSIFGQYPKISIEETWNMVISDGWLVPYPGDRLATQIQSSGQSRGEFNSTNLNKLVIVVENNVYLVNNTLSKQLIFTLNTFQGNVYIAEDNAGHIAVCDMADIWIYTISTGVAVKATLDGTTPIDFVPGYVSFQNTRFISVDLNTSTWRLSDPANNNLRFPNTSQFVGAFQVKTDKPVASVPIPGKGNLMLILGSVSGQFWTDLGLQLFPYQLNQGINLDYGVANADTIASLEDITCMLTINEKAAPVIRYSTGGIPERISTDGIDYKLGQLTAPRDSHAFMFNLNGHTYYQLTFPTDNVTLLYDFTLNKFFNLCNSYQNAHNAKKIAYFNNTYYYITYNDANLYEFNSNITTYNGNLIPRIRIPTTIRNKRSEQFVCSSITFPIEQGFDGTAPAVDLAISVDGGYNFGSYDRQYLNPIGKRMNKFVYYNLGWSNELTPQFRFWSDGRIVVGDGEASIYQ